MKWLKEFFRAPQFHHICFLLLIETKTISVRQNKNIKGIPVEGCELKKKILFQPMIQLVFWMGPAILLINFFITLNRFAKFSGCNINLSKFNAIWIGTKKWSHFFPFYNQGLI